MILLCLLLDVGQELKEALTRNSLLSLQLTDNFLRAVVSPGLYQGHLQTVNDGPHVLTCFKKARPSNHLLLIRAHLSMFWSRVKVSDEGNN